MASVAPTIREMNTYLLDYIRSRRPTWAKT